ncbi:MAG: low-complexity protein [Halobacteria archaeon]|nr:low-complexity protein [Halobacteria archaeon]
MSDKPVIKPLAIAVGTAIVTSLASVNTANAAQNPFAMTELSSGYMVAEMAEGKCGEGKCGGAKATEEAKTMEEGKCGEGKCGGAAKTTEEGKCGEGKCGASK